MAKLSKHEITAVANKLKRTLERMYQDSHKRAVMDYIPSSQYIAILDLLDKRDELDKKIKGLSKEYGIIINEIQNVLENYNMSCRSVSQTKEEIARDIILKECKIKEAPSIEELKEDITIAAIDDSFDTNAFIEQYITKCKENEV